MPKADRCSGKPKQCRGASRKQLNKLDQVYQPWMQQKNVELQRKVTLENVDDSLTHEKKQVKMKLEIQYMMERLINKFGSDVQAMERDPLNVLQFTAHKLQREYEKMMALDKAVDVQLNEMYLHPTKDQNKEEPPAEVQTMNCAYAARIAQLQQFMAKRK